MMSYHIETLWRYFLLFGITRCALWGSSQYHDRFLHKCNQAVDCQKRINGEHSLWQWYESNWYGKRIPRKSRAMESIPHWKTPSTDLHLFWNSIHRLHLTSAVFGRGWLLLETIVFVAAWAAATHGRRRFTDYLLWGWEDQHGLWQEYKK